jgi:hypothetical protein
MREHIPDADPHQERSRDDAIAARSIRMVLRR